MSNIYPKIIYYHFIAITAQNSIWHFWYISIHKWDLVLAVKLNPEEVDAADACIWYRCSYTSCRCGWTLHVRPVYRWVPTVRPVLHFHLVPDATKVTANLLHMATSPPSFTWSGLSGFPLRLFCVWCMSRQLSYCRRLVQRQVARQVEEAQRLGQDARPIPPTC